MLTNLPIAGKPQDPPTNGKGLSYGPCPRGAPVKKFAVPHCSIFFLLLLCLNPPKAHKEGAQKTDKVNLSKGGSAPDAKGWTSAEETAQCVPARQKTQRGTVNLTMAHHIANARVPSPLPGETLRHVLATAK